MRRPITTKQAAEMGFTESALRWKVRSGEWQRIERGIYLIGTEPATPIERALATVIVTGGVASGTLAAVLHQLDGVQLNAPYATVQMSKGCDRSGIRRRDLSPHCIVNVNGYLCTDGLQTLIDLAGVVTDRTWEQALESALRNRLVEIEQIVDRLQIRCVGNKRIRRVLALRAPHAPPTESLLETLMVQLIRNDTLLPDPARQVEVFKYGRLIARVDLAWPDHGVFIELDGQHHKDQPVYDARRETAIVAATGWLPGRFTWHEVVRTPKSTAQRLVELFHARDRSSHPTYRC